MDYDINLVRNIFKWCVDHIPAEERSYKASEIEIPKYSKFQIVYHVKWLVDAGYIEANNVSAGNNINYMLDSITISGYEYYGIIKSKAGWKLAKEYALKYGLPLIPQLIPPLLEVINKIPK